MRLKKLVFCTNNDLFYGEAMEENNMQFKDLSSADSLTVAKEIVGTLYKKLALGIKLIYAADTTVLTDYYVVAYARSLTHARALANELERVLGEAGIPPKHPEGIEGGEWILVDAGDVIVHVFSKEAGEFYRFERLFKEEAFLSVSDIVKELSPEESSEV